MMTLTSSLHVIIITILVIIGSISIKSIFFWLSFSRYTLSRWLGILKKFPLDWIDYHYQTAKSNGKESNMVCDDLCGPHHMDYQFKRRERIIHQCFNELEWITINLLIDDNFVRVGKEVRVIIRCNEFNLFFTMRHIFIRIFFQFVIDAWLTRKWKNKIQSHLC